MDPNSTLELIVDETAAAASRLDAIDDLTRWLNSGGFMPVLHGVLDAPTFGGNTAARTWLERKLTAMAHEMRATT
jgi:hypothetical protein